MSTSLRIAGRSLVLFVFVLASTSCFAQTGKCPPPPRIQAGINASGTTSALSCVFSLELEGITYVPWCAGVKADLLGDEIGRASDRSITYVARSIQGVEPEQAVAIRERANPMLAQECGTWRFTPGLVEGDAAIDLARRVVQHRFLDDLTDDEA